jgi:hypothetical protein
MALFDRFKKKKQSQESEQPEEVSNEPGLLMVHFLFENEFDLNQEKILAELKKEFKQVETGDSSEKPLMYFFPEYTVTYQDGSAPAQCIIFIPETPSLQLEKLAEALQQSWHWPEANEVVSTCQYEFLVTDFLSKGLAYQERVEYFQKFVTALVKATRPQALHFSGSDKLVNPFAYVLAITDEQPDLLHGLMNVRFFNISNGKEGEMFMDTVGLHVLGLPDFQVRFTNLDPGQVAGLLTFYGSYLYEHGAVIEAGNTIQGPEADDIWTCYFAEASVAHKRVVIDLVTNEEDLS